MNKEGCEIETNKAIMKMRKHIAELEDKLESDIILLGSILKNAYIASAEPREKRIAELEKENAELRKVAEFQLSSNMSRYFENKKLKEGLAVGSIFNKALNSMNKSLEEERDKYRNMVFDKIAQLDQAKEIINELLMNSYDENTREKALNFLYPDKKEDK